MLHVTSLILPDVAVGVVAILIQHRSFIQELAFVF